MKINKTVKVWILSSLISIIATSGIAVAAVSLNAKEIPFTSKDENWQVDNVEDAMNDLYDLGKIASNAKVYKLGNGFSFDITNIVGAENVGNYDANNFLVVWNGPSIGRTQVINRGQGNGMSTVLGYVTIGNSGAYSKSYKNGILTVTGGTVSVTERIQQWYAGKDPGSVYEGSISFSVTPTVYFLPGVEITEVN